MKPWTSLTWTHPSCLVAAAAVAVVHTPWPWAWGAGAVSALVLVLLGGRGPVLGAAVAAFTLAWALVGLPSLARWPFDPGLADRGLGVVTSEYPWKLRLTALGTGTWSGEAWAGVRVAGGPDRPGPLGSVWRWEGRVDPDRGTLVWRSGTQEAWTDPGAPVREAARKAVRGALAGLGEGEAALAEALLLGASDNLCPAEAQAFRRAGCSHVLALSGMHLGLLALGVSFFLKGRGPALAVLAASQAVLGLFCWLAGPLPSLWRAWAMAALGGLAALAREPLGTRELLARSYLASVLLWPETATSLSLELSFLALGGLLAWGGPWERALRPWVGRGAAASLGPSAAAVAATWPLTLAVFGQGTWIGILLTPPLVFLTTVYLGASALVLGAGLVWAPAAGLAAPGFSWARDLIFSVTAWAQPFPPWAAGPAWALWSITALGLAGFFLYKRGYRRAFLPVSLNYDSPASLQAFLESRGYNALKRWGQNFLINAGARKQILASLDLAPGEPVWEVGPGLGALTHHLVEAGHPVTVFEIDPGYAAFLREEFGGAPAGFEVVEGDVVKTWKSKPLSGIKCVGNLPYNAASAIVADFVEGGYFPGVFTVTVQLEMAQRMTASPGNKNYSSFSVLCQSAFVLSDVVTLRPGSFYPAPEVTSRVVKLTPHGRYPGLDHRRFSTFVRECFSSRRKTLRNNLPGAASALHVGDADLTAAFAQAGIDLSLRAETLTVAQFVRVFQTLVDNRSFGLS